MSASTECGLTSGPTELGRTDLISVTVARIVTDLKKCIEVIEGRVVGRNEVGSENRS